jgi:hypothetical protein
LADSTPTDADRNSRNSQVGSLAIETVDSVQ